MDGVGDIGTSRFNYASRTRGYITESIIALTPSKFPVCAVYIFCYSYNRDAYVARVSMRMKYTNNIWAGLHVICFSSTKCTLGFNVSFIRGEYAINWPWFL